MRTNSLVVVENAATIGGLIVFACSFLTAAATNMGIASLIGASLGFSALLAVKSQTYETDRSIWRLVKNFSVLFACTSCTLVGIWLAYELYPDYTYKVVTDFFHWSKGLFR